MDQANYLTNLSNMLLEFSKANILCDTTIVAKNHEFTAHSAILAAASPTLRSAFKNSFSKRNIYRIELLETDSATVENVLFLIYTGNLKPLENANLANDKSAELIMTCEHLGLDWMWSQLDLTQSRQSTQQESVVENSCEMIDDCSQSPQKIHKTSEETSTESILKDDDRQPADDDTKQFDIGLVKEEFPKSVSDKTPLQSKSFDESTKKQELSCDICSKVFLSENLLKAHHVRHKTELLMCEHCGCQFKYPGAMRRHSEVHKADSGESGVVCHVCGVVFNGVDELESHLSTHGITSASWCCGSCQVHFDDEVQLENHLQEIHADDQPFVCSWCQKSFHEKNQLLKHMLIHNKGKNFICEVCSLGFSEEYYLKKHQHTHNSAFDNVCPSCGKQFKLPEYLKVHMKSSCTEENELHSTQVASNKLHSCSVCNRSFVHLSYLKKHARIHVEEKPYECGTCGKKFKVNCIQQHMLTHSKERPYACDKCVRRFTRQADLQAHLQTHSDTKSHWCPVCMRGFHKKGDLQRHTRIHTGERPYVCETCGKSFKILFHLRLHSYVHSTDRPHKCNMCGKAFSSTVRLKKHEFIHSGLRPYPCPICHRRFNRQANMKSHMKTHDQKPPKLDKVVTENYVEMVVETEGNFLQSHHSEVESVEIVYCKVEQPDVLVALPVETFQSFKL